MATPIRKLQLQGFNNLTKTLSFNVYDVSYARTASQRREYIAYVDEAYNAKRLTDTLARVSDLIGATVLNIAHQDYDPQGASAAALIAETSLAAADEYGDEPGDPYAEAVVAHLDKSHISVHTYPESHPDDGISTFRADIEVATCGEITPLRALDFLIESFESDIVIMDYRVRGFTRDITGQKHFIDHEIRSIRDFINPDIRSRYRLVDVNTYSEYTFHTKMMRKEFDLNDYLFGGGDKNLSKKENRWIWRRLKREMEDIFYGAAGNEGE